jgi:hypothetical protein
VPAIVSEIRTDTPDTPIDTVKPVAAGHWVSQVDMNSQNPHEQESCIKKGSRRDLALSVMATRNPGNWSRRQDYPAWRRALPISASPRRCAGAQAVEPRFSSCRKNRGDRIRTCDLVVPNHALYQAKLRPDITVKQ